MKNSTLIQLILLYVIFGIIVSLGCGDETYYSDEPKKGKGLSAEVVGVLQSKCSKCHAGRSFMSDYNDFKTIAEPQVRAGKMPPGGGLSPKDKEILLSQ
jgi:hypothetical protein